MVSLMKPTLVIMAKAPRIGTAKSRLARDIGLVSAWRVNRALNCHTMRVTKDPRWNTVLAVASRRDLNVDLPGVWPLKARRQAQKSGDLGARLQHVFRSAPFGPVMVIGTDCPALRRDDLAAAISALHRADAVLGPATDGGFWLLGLNARLAKKANFSNIRWSSSHALDDTVKAITAKKVLYIRTLTDVDDAESYRQAYCVKRRPIAETSAKRGLSTER